MKNIVVPATILHILLAMHLKKGKYMANLTRIERISDSVQTIEARFDSFSAAVAEYRSVLGSPVDTEKIAIGGGHEEQQAHMPTSVHTRHEPSSTEAPSQTGEQESLFDTVLQRLIQGHDVRITSSDTEGEDSLNIILESTADPVLLLTTAGEIIDLNPAFCNTFGYSKQELEAQIFFDLVPSAYHSTFRAKFAEFNRSIEPDNPGSVDDIVAFRGIHADGSVKSMECLVSSYLQDSNRIVVMIIRDLSFNRHLFEQLKESKDNYDALSETITEAILRIDEQFQVVFANSGVRTTFGYDPAEVVGRQFEILFPPEIFSRHEKDFLKYFFVDDQHRKDLGLKKTLEILGRHKNRGVSPMEMSFGNSKDFRGRTLTCIIRDITQRKNIERRLRHLAYHDKLTNLGNRDLFNDDMRTTFADLKKFPGRKSALMFLDLDGFKQVNDTLGHDAGDELLVETARRLRSVLRESDTVYRFGGDEFVVLAPSVKSKGDASVVAAKLLAAVRTPYTLAKSTTSDTAVNVGVSIGVAMIPENGTSIVRVTKCADLAMYCAKEEGKNRFIFFSPNMRQQATERWELEQGIKRALNNGEFQLHYQPLVDAEGFIEGFEALIRWNHRKWGYIPPGKFIPIAEETGLINPLGNWIMETAFRLIKSLNDGDYPNLYGSINLSVRQFEQKNVVELISGIINRVGVEPRNIRLEVTETCIMQNPDSAIAKMEELKTRNAGIKIVIDDFGTGYSSLSYLSKLPADSIKIDISFVSQLFTQHNEKIVNAIISLAQNLELDLVAEGVESKEQWDFFNNRNCGTLQGFHFAKAVDSDTLMKLLRQKRLG